MILYPPLKPAICIQPFGENPEYYARFKDHLGNPIKGHMGRDYSTNPSHGQPIYAAHDGSAQFLRDEHGGEGVYNTGSGFRTINWHLIGDTDPAFPNPMPNDGTLKQVKAGDLIGYANNTGAPFESTGPHFHFALYMLSTTGEILNINNGFNGAMDPAPFLSNIAAQDLALYNSLQLKLVELLTALLASLTK